MQPTSDTDTTMTQCGLNVFGKYEDVDETKSKRGNVSSESQMESQHDPPNIDHDPRCSEEQVTICQIHVQMITGRSACRKKPRQYHGVPVSIVHVFLAVRTMTPSYHLEASPPGTRGKTITFNPSAKLDHAH
jgi:hypothetical protein